MSLFGPSQVSGDVVTLKRTNPLHLDSEGLSGAAASAKDETGGFQGLLLRALDGVNGITQKSLSLEQQMVVAPQSVNAHDVTIALGEANLALSMTKAIVDRVIRAYQDIINVR